MTHTRMTFSAVVFCEVLLVLGCEGPPVSVEVPSWISDEGIPGTSDALSRIEVGGKRGFIDKTGKVVIRPQFDRAWGFSEGLARVVNGDRFGFIGKNGKPAFAATFDEAMDFQDGRAAVLIGGKWGFIDRTGRVCIQPSFEEVKNGFADGRCPIAVRGKYGFIDPNGRVAIPAQFDETIGFRRGLAAVRVGNFWGFVDPNGGVVLPIVYGGALWFCDDPEYAWVNIGGKTISNPSVGHISLGGAWQFIDKKGKVVIPPCSTIGIFTEGLCLRQGPGIKFGYMDREGSWHIDPRYDNGLPFQEGLAPVCIGRKWGFIDKMGREAISPQFDEAYLFRDGLARVRVRDKWGYIEPSGEFVWKPTR